MRSTVRVASPGSHRADELTGGRSVLLLWPTARDHTSRSGEVTVPPVVSESPRFLPGLIPHGLIPYCDPSPLPQDMLDGLLICGVELDHCRLVAAPVGMQQEGLP